MTKYIFVTGGVVSGLGKGVSAASLGRLLKARGYSIFVQKLDPYLNVDPGTMSPYEHGEVYVTHDGGETDLDLGHYERFIGTKFTKLSNYTSGRIYHDMLEAERQGKFGGKTLQIIPHITKHIEELILKAGRTSKADFVITEVGGTVGDIESQPFIYALANFHQLHKNSTFFMHATYVPYLEASKEFKSKPTQHSIKELRQYGINPNMILLRANKTPTDDIIDKTAKVSLLDHNSIIGVPNSDNIYKVPLFFEEKKMAQTVLKHFGMPNRKAKLDDWKKLVNLIDTKPSKTLEVAMIGKYIELEDAYMSIIEALKISSYYNNVKINMRWIQSEDLTTKNIAKKLKGIDGAIILPGFGKRGFDGKVVAAKYLRDKNLPTFGICYGMQAMTVVQAQYKGIKDATSSEVSDEGTFVIDIIRGKNKTDKLGGTLRLGETETRMVKGTVVQKLYGTKSSFERHRHRFEVNPAYVEQIQDKDFLFSGFDAKNDLAEVCEMPKKKFYVGLQAHPEFNANPLKEHPVFRGFVKSMIK